MKQLLELLIERATVDSKIRAYRVQEVRKRLAQMSEVSDKQDLLVREMERRLTMVHYYHEDFDDLLEPIEDSF